MLLNASKSALFFLLRTFPKGSLILKQHQTLAVTRYYPGLKQSNNIIIHLCYSRLFLQKKMGNLCLSVPAVAVTPNPNLEASLDASKLSLQSYLDLDLAEYFNPHQPPEYLEAPLATEENLEDPDPLPNHYRVEANTDTCLVIERKKTDPT